MLVLMVFLVIVIIILIYLLHAPNMYNVMFNVSFKINVFHIGTQYNAFLLNDLKIKPTHFFHLWTVPYRLYRKHGKPSMSIRKTRNTRNVFHIGTQYNAFLLND